MCTYNNLFYVFFGCFLFTGQSTSSQTSVPDVCKDTKTQLDMNTCLDSDYGDADRDLNALYTSVKRKPGCMKAVPSNPLCAPVAWGESRERASLSCTPFTTLGVVEETD